MEIEGKAEDGREEWREREDERESRIKGRGRDKE